MTKLTVQQIMYDKMEVIDKKLDKLIPVVEGLKVKAAIAGGMAGIVGTGILSLIVSYMK